MSSLRSALEEWSQQDLDQVEVDVLADDLVELEAVVGLLEVERARRLDRYQTVGGPARHGYPSVTSFLIDRCRIASGRARRLVAIAQGAMRCRLVSDAWGSGRVSTDQAHRLLEASGTAPAAFPEAEGALIEIVAPLTPGDTRRALNYWVQSVVGPEDDGQCFDQRGVSLSQTIGGMGRVDGWLTPVAFQTLHTAISALMPPPVPGDHRSALQRRHDALEDLARGYLDHGETPVVGGERPHISLVCDLAALQGVAGGRHETENGEVVDIETLRAIACDSSVSRVVLGPESETIDVGRRTRVIPAALRRAIIVRDRHCTYPGCERPARWSDVHHERHWVDHGPTNLANCRLLCRFHHTLTHRREAADPPDRSPTAVRPTGRPGLRGPPR